MKKFISVTVFLFISCFATLYGKKIRFIISERPITKTVRFSIYSAGYSAPIYEKSKANVQLTICKYYQGKYEVVWEGIVDEGGVKNYPVDHESFYREVTVHNVFDKKEILVAYYSVSYFSKGSKMSYTKGTRLSEGDAPVAVNIEI